MQENQQLHHSLTKLQTTLQKLRVENGFVCVTAIEGLHTLQLFNRLDFGVLEWTIERV